MTKDELLALCAAYPGAAVDCPFEAMSWYVTPPGANGLLLFLNATENYA